jgi:hypothetical protein
MARQRLPWSRSNPGGGQESVLGDVIGALRRASRSLITCSLDSGWMLADGKIAKCPCECAVFRRVRHTLTARLVTRDDTRRRRGVDEDVVTRITLALALSVSLAGCGDLGFDVRTLSELERAAVPARFAEAFPAVDGLFTILRDAYEEESDDVSVTYEPVTGVPVEFFIDYLEMAADEEPGMAVTEDVVGTQP